MSISRVLARAFRRERFGSRINLYTANRTYKKTKDAIAKGILSENRCNFSFDTADLELIKNITQNMLEKKDKTYFVNERLIRGSIFIPTSVLLVPAILHSSDSASFFYMVPEFQQITIWCTAVSTLIGYYFTNFTGSYCSKQVRKLGEINNYIDKKIKEKGEAEHIKQEVKELLEADLEEPLEKPLKAEKLFENDLDLEDPKPIKTKNFFKNKSKKASGQRNSEMKQMKERLYDNQLLIKASEKGDLESVWFLINERQVDVNAKNGQALDAACRNGHLHVVKYLVEAGANIHMADDYALRHSSRNGQLPIVKFLLEQGARNIDGALEAAVDNNHDSVVDLLLDWKTKYDTSQ